MPQRVTVAAEQVRRLLGDQFPQWADLPVRPVANSGWDNVTFHLGDAMVARLPSERGPYLRPGPRAGRDVPR